MAVTERPAKRAKFLEVDDSDSDSSSASAANIATNGFKINEEYAKRFEHNKKREEQHRLEEKYGKQQAGLDSEDEETDSEDAESEDDDAELATKEVDDEIMATLQAIRNKDPRVYDANVKFYKEYVPEEEGEKKPEQPVYLRDYHRENLLAGGANGDDEEAAPVTTYQDEQDELKRNLVGSMHASTALGKDQEDSGDDEDFLVAKSKPKHRDLPTKTATAVTDADVKQADKDPETYLSNFMAARAWLPTEESRWQAFDSDDSDEDKRADEYEAAYNLRFEDPKTANEKLQTFARDVGKYSARRDEQSSRKRARDREREAKEEAKRERDEEKARLRRLKLDEAEEKVKKIKEAAGLRGEQVAIDQWRDVLEGDFDDEKWEAEMERRFGDEYYADVDAGLDSDVEMDDGEKKKRKPKKPKWSDDIDINDLVPDFKPDEDENPGFALSDAEGNEDDAEESRPKKKTKKDREKEKAEAKKTARLERRALEEMVDASLPVDAATANNPTPFRYRETSPTTFGMSARDILFADDKALNEFAGLKKLSAWREDERKKGDKKRYSKKQRLRQWRKDTFGSQDEPTGGFEKVLGDYSADAGAEQAKKKRKRSGKGKKEKS